MKAITKERLTSACDEAQALCDAATPGPWSVEVDRPGSPVLFITSPFGYIADLQSAEFLVSPPDSAFITVSRALLPAMLPAMRDLAKACEFHEPFCAKLEEGPEFACDCATTKCMDLLESTRVFVEAVEAFR